MIGDGETPDISTHIPVLVLMMMTVLELIFNKVCVPQMFVFSVAEDNFTWPSLFSLIHIGQLLTKRDTDTARHIIILYFS